jgi:hypothetical protein
MDGLDDYVTVEQAVADPRIPYTAHWLRVLAASSKVEAMKVGTARRSPWLLRLASLLEYIAERRGEHETD